MNRLLVPAPGVVGERIRAKQAESHHLLDVQRVARGRVVRVADGRGWQADAELVDVEDGCAVMLVLSVVVGGAVPTRVVVLGLPKPTALEESLVLGTEAGATAFILVRTLRTPPGELRPDRIERVLRAAVTQCGRADLPTIVHAGGAAGTASLERALAGDVPAARYLATPGAHDADLAGPRPRQHAAPVALAIGPEGGFAPEEQALLVANGFSALSLGPFLLRTPTAVAVGLGRLWGDDA